MALQVNELDFANAPAFRTQQPIMARQVEVPGSLTTSEELGIDTDTPTTLEVAAGDWVISDEVGIRRVENEEFQERFTAIGDLDKTEGAFVENGPLVRGVRLEAPATLVFNDGTEHELDRGDALIQAPDGTVRIEDAETFVGRYMRCTDSGEAICQQRDHLQTQARSITALMDDGREENGASKHLRDLQTLRNGIIARYMEQQAVPTDPNAPNPDHAESEQTFVERAEELPDMVRSDIYLMDLAIAQAGQNDEIDDERAQEIHNNTLIAIPDMRDDENLAAPAQVPGNIARAVSHVNPDLGQEITGRMTAIKSAPSYTQKAIRSFARDLFCRYTSVPLEEVRMMADRRSDGDAPTAISELYTIVSQEGRQKQGPHTVNADQSMPGMGCMTGYSADVEVWNYENTDYMFVSDFMGVYVYAWPAQSPALTYVQNDNVADNDPELDDDEEDIQDLGPAPLGAP